MKNGKVGMADGLLVLSMALCLFFIYVHGNILGKTAFPYGTGGWDCRAC